MSLRIGIGTNLRITGSGIILDPDLILYMNGLITPLSNTQQLLLNTFIVNLKTALGINNLSDIFDGMWIYAGETEESSLRNLVERAHDSTAHGTYTFTQFEGIEGNGIDGYINTHFHCTTDAVNYTLNNAGMGYYARKDYAWNTNKIMGAIVTGSLYITAKYSIIDLRSRIHNLTNITISYGAHTGIGMRSIYRYNANSAYGYINEHASVESIAASINIPNGLLFFLADNTALGLGLPLNFVDTQIALGYIGKSLTQAQHISLVNIFEAYMDAYGTGVLI